MENVWLDMIDDQTPTCEEYNRRNYKKKYVWLVDWFRFYWQPNVMRQRPFHVYGDELFKMRIQNELEQHPHYLTMNRDEKRRTVTNIIMFLWVYRYDNWIYFIESFQRKVKQESQKLLLTA